MELILLFEICCNCSAEVKRFLLHIKARNEMDAQIIIGNKNMRNNETWIVMLPGW
jgi:hypothetical protein